ncbi:hypothetical protein [Methylocella silvestris]|uniref:hypothetical protein n=1 Tax=Methylocella silvestris TaxID=199596 RepID=UPI0011D10D59|nr:hypothetical protein [Methylocella silvestris]
MTVTFKVGSIQTSQCLGQFEHFYHLMCRKLVNNIDRRNKQHLYPLAIAFVDNPSTRYKSDKPKLFGTHPSVAPHVHSVMIIHPSIKRKFLERYRELEELWQDMNPRHGTIKISVSEMLYYNRLIENYAGNEDEIESKLKGWIGYSGKLQTRFDRPDCDLFTILPPSGKNRFDRF